ncbi:hypothetical protein NIES2100_48850 [Calothrix sp. NIES-2100]|nr:hypothetical protein NIES2100_48850 [Calothrix sp. NIES-2100]
MFYIKCVLHTFFNMQLLTTFFLSLILGLTLATLSAYQSPPDQQPPSGYSDSSGVR